MTTPMNPELWKRVRRIFDEVLDLSDTERTITLAKASGGDENLRCYVEELLKAHEATGHLLDRPVLRLGDQEPSETVREEATSEAVLTPEIGPYRPLKLIGQGGMGRVFLAERSDGSFERQVAVKLLHPGLGSQEVLQRFRRERQILANLEHPNIAGLLDGGSTGDGQPFLVMEYVAGIPLDEYCRSRRPSLEFRLRLFLSICSAVEAAHRKLVVHRDLKPANILVTAAGEPKLLDFGIAKLLSPRALPKAEFLTEPGRTPLTPEFASPEQVRGSVITTASDVYSLGAVAYALLTGRGPHRLRTRDPLEWLEVVCKAEVEPPSQVLQGVANAAIGFTPRLLRGDLDRIVLMALHKDPDRRYASVERLASDVRAFLDGQPVEASGDGLLYRLGKFFRRHKVAVTAAVTALLGLLVFSVTLWVQQQRLIQERDLATSTAGMLQDLFRFPDPTQSRGETITAREILDSKAYELGRPLAGALPVRAALRETLGTTYLHLGLYEEATEQLQRSLNLGSSIRDPAENVGVLLQLARAHQLQGQWPEAEGLARRALMEARRLKKGHVLLEARSLLRLGKVHELQGRLSVAEEELRQGLQLVEPLVSEAAQEALAIGFDDLATVLELRGRQDEATETYRKALAVLRGLYGEHHPEVAFSLNNLALSLRNKDQGEALELLLQAESILRKLFKDGDPQLASTLGNLGLVSAEGQRLKEAESFYQEALRVLGEGKEDNPRAASILNNLADLRLQQGNLEEAESLHRQALALRRRWLGERHRATAISFNNLGYLVMGKNDLDEAAVLLKMALEASTSSFGQLHSQTASVLNNLALLAERQGDVELAEERFFEAARSAVGALGEEHRQVAPFFYNLARIRQSRGDLVGAEESYLRALKIARGHAAVDPTDLGHYLLGLASLRLESARPGEAVELSQEGLGWLRPRADTSDRWLLSGQRILGQGLTGLGRYEEAEEVLLACHETLRSAYGVEDAATRTALKTVVELYETWGYPEKAKELLARLELSE